MYHPRTDITRRYRYRPVDFIKHLASTTLAILVLTGILSATLREPVHPTLRIATVAQTQPVMFYRVALGDLAGTGEIANYGPPYNNGTGMIQSALQKWVGILHPVVPVEDFVLRPLAMAAHLNPSLTPLLNQWRAASRPVSDRWVTTYQTALTHARVVGGQVVVPAGDYGPVPALLKGLWQLGQSGLMSGALDRTPADYQFNNQNFLLFLQGEPLHQAAARLQLKGSQWGIIHEEKEPYPGPWWMTVVTAIYQIPAIANAPNADALALGGGLLLFVVLILAPWIPRLNRLPRHLTVHRMIWRRYYREHPPSER
ncbi:MAG: cytochrome B6 [Thermaerobacter sp.]|nr:cytochrome B6 [Thermaerobacter sp.]